MGSKIASEIRSTEVMPFTEGMPVPGGGPWMVFASAAVPPTNNAAPVDRLDLAGDRLDLAIGPIPARPVEQRRQPEARAWVRSAAASRMRCRAVAISSSVAPVSLSALARSIGWTVRPGISVVSTGRRGGGAGVAAGFVRSHGRVGCSAAPGNGTAVGWTGRPVPSCLPATADASGQSDRAAPPDPSASNRLGGGIDIRYWTSWRRRVADADMEDWLAGTTERTPGRRQRHQYGWRGHAALVSKIRPMPRALLAPTSLRESAGSPVRSSLIIRSFRFLR